MKRKITSGTKFSDSHQTIIKKAVPVISELKKSEHISKIVIGKIKNTRSRVPKLLTSVTGTSVRLTVKSQGELQEFYLIGSNLNTINKQVARLSV